MLRVNALLVYRQPPTRSRLLWHPATIR